jgi:hypothetical protein
MRLRYFFGKHLSVADFMDEQRYHIAKQSFHNQRLHGTGVLCGLKVSLLDGAGAIIRVGKGAALDRCGREIVVGFDQCIDVDAWYRAEHQRHREEDPQSDWPAGHLDDDGKLPLCVVLRYSECPIHPEPAPRDPCSCAEGGCEFGNISEGFELKLLIASEAHAIAAAELFPTRDQISAALTESAEGLDLLRRLAIPITEACPEAIEDTWLLLDCFTAVLNDADPPSVIAMEDLGQQQFPPVLLSTEVIQYLLARLYADREVDVGGPAVIDVLWEKVDEYSYRMVLLLDNSVESSTIDRGDSFGLRKLVSTGWDPPGSGAVVSEYAVGRPEPAIYVTIDNSEGYLKAGERYHLYANQNIDPIVDSELRRLRPHDFIWRFRLGQSDSGDLVMQRPPFNVTP